MGSIRGGGEDLGHEVGRHLVRLRSEHAERELAQLGGGVVEEEVGEHHPRRQRVAVHLARPVLLVVALLVLQSAQVNRVKAENAKLQRDIEHKEEILREVEEMENMQQELEKNAIRDKLLETAGERAYEMAQKVAEKQCLSRFGIYVPEYTSPMKSDGVTGDLETDSNDTENGDMFLSLSPAARARAKHIRHFKSTSRYYQTRFRKRFTFFISTLYNIFYFF